MKKKNISEGLIELEIESLGSEGVSIARKEGKVYILKGGLPGEKVMAFITKSKKNHSEGFVREILESSEDRIAPKCKYFGNCGGCSWQNLSYAKQIEWKRTQVIDALTRIGKVEPKVVHETMPSPREFGYRNKMEFSFGSQRWLTFEEMNSDLELDKYFALGLHVPGKYDKIIDIDFCYIQPEEGNLIINAVREKAKNDGIAPHDFKHHTGFLKNVVLRFSVHESALMTILITSPITSQEEEDFAAWFVSELPKMFPFVKIAAHAENDKLSSVANGKIRSDKNDLFITESILGCNFKISPFSFFQTNSYQLDSFIGKILEFAKFNTGQTVWDLYSGCGSITLPAAPKVKRIIGIELIDSAVSDAKENAKMNGLSNVEFYQADLHSKKIPELLESLPQPDVIIVDPPRIGMNENLINHILKIMPERIVYVSCNPATQARDLAMLSEHYAVGEVQPVDMFPHTYHIETIVELTRR